MSGGLPLAERFPILTPAGALAFILASTSIGSLLIYFLGWLSFPTAVWLLLMPASILLALVSVWARGARPELYRRIALGLWAGSFATLAYDIVRVPLIHAGIPIFKAISYFGTLLTGSPNPSFLSELLGWTYHFSNGIGFAIMYTMLVPRIGLVTAVIWGVVLEVVMLATPYAEIFGYQRSGRFLAITVGAHVFYGIGLWLSARWLERSAPGISAGRLAAWLAGPILIGLTAWDFHALHARTIPASPPPFIGPHVYVTWDVPEPDRFGAIWLMRTYVDTQATFHFIEPMSHMSFGIPFDLPEAEIRRETDKATFQVVLERAGRQDDPAMQSLSRMCYMTEIRPWALVSDPASTELASDLRRRLGDCQRMSDCLEEGLAWFAETYKQLSEQTGAAR